MSNTTYSTQSNFSNRLYSDYLYSESDLKIEITPKKDSSSTHSKHVSTDVQTIPHTKKYTYTEKLNGLPQLHSGQYSFNTKGLLDVLEVHSVTQQDSNEGGEWRLTCSYYHRIGGYVVLLPEGDESALIPNSGEVYKISKEELKEEEKQRSEVRKAEFDALKNTQLGQFNDLKKAHANAQEKLQQEKLAQQKILLSEWHTEEEKLKKRYSDEQTELRNRLTHEKEVYNALNSWEKFRLYLQGATLSTVTRHYEILIKSLKESEQSELHTLSNTYRQKLNDNTPLNELHKKQQEELDILIEQHRLEQEELKAQHEVEDKRQKERHETEQSLIRQMNKRIEKEQELSDINHLSS